MRCAYCPDTATIRRRWISAYCPRKQGKLVVAKAPLISTCLATWCRQRFLQNHLHR